ncbi:MAG TPA: SCO family protein [Pyrinomonadaceae bacterium]|nr:SCO family protein [Pyrinomonadaceae bacterium]
MRVTAFVGNRWCRRGRPGRRVYVVGFLLFAFCLLAAASARGQYAQPPVGPVPTGNSTEVLKKVGIEQKLNSQIPLDLSFRDETGREVRLGEYFRSGKPVVLTLVYYECPMLCNQVLNGMVGTLQALSFTPGREFEVVTVSFDPREGPELAARKKETYLKRFGRAGAGEGWHFLTGDKDSIDRLAQSVGFRYVWDEQSKQFAHASAIMVATPEGRLSHYFYGIEYSPKDLRLALVEASKGSIGSPVDELILYCYHYDPSTGKFAPVMAVLRAAGVLTVFALAALIIFLVRRTRRNAERWDEEIKVGGAV